MLIIGKHSLASFLRILVDILLVVNLVVLLLLPFILNALYENPELLRQLDRYDASQGPDIPIRSEYPSDLPPTSYPFYLGFLYLSGFCTAWILLEGRLILRRLEKGLPFAAAQAGSFNRIAAACALLTLAFVIKVAVYNTLLTMFCAAVFLLLAMIALVLAEVFRQAHQVKSENELTI